MKNFERFGNQIIYYKSSENMEELLNNSIDTIITSPPYNLGKFYSDDLGKSYDDNVPLADYLDFLKRVWRECYRVLNTNGIFFLNFGDSAQTQGLSEKVVQSTIDCGFKRLQTIIWVKSLLGKGHYTPSGGLKRLNNIWEYIFILVKNKKKYSMNPKAIGIPYADRSNIGRYSNEDLRDAGNVWFIPYSKTTGLTIKKGHEAPFPIELPSKCILLSEGSNILDPFAGTGTTLAAASILGKKGFGYEKFPRREIIKQKILSSPFHPVAINLIPHLELTIKFLAKICEKTIINPLDYQRFFRFTKKEKNEFDIANKVLSNLNIHLPFLGINEKTEDSLNNLRKKSDKTPTLTEYFKKYP